MATILQINPSAALLTIYQAMNARSAVADAAYLALITDRMIAYTSISAARIVTLPAASAFQTGATLKVIDESGACSGTNTITIAAVGADTISGATTFVLNSAYGFVTLESNGVNKWSRC